MSITDKMLALFKLQIDQCKSHYDLDKLEKGLVGRKGLLRGLPDPEGIMMVMAVKDLIKDKRRFL